jgi:hypothetical protein
MYLQHMAMEFWKNCRIALAVRAPRDVFMADETLSPRAVAVKSLIGVGLIDGGDTIDVRFAAPDGQMIAVLIPQAVFAELQARELGASTRRAGLEQTS